MIEMIERTNNEKGIELLRDYNRYGYKHYVIDHDNMKILLSGYYDTEGFNILQIGEDVDEDIDGLIIDIFGIPTKTSISYEDIDKPILNSAFIEVTNESLSTLKDLNNENN